MYITSTHVTTNAIWPSNMEALNGIATPIFAVNTAGVVTIWNRKMQHATCIPNEQITERLLSDFLTDQIDWENALSRALCNAIDIDTVSDDILCTIGIKGATMTNEVRTFSVRVVPHYSVGTNTLLGAVCFVEATIRPELAREVFAIPEAIYSDVREKTKVETEQKLAAYFAHELRNPLSALDSALNAILHAKYDEMISIIPEMQACITVMSSIMNNLIDVRKFEEGRVTVTNAPMSLRTLMSEVHRTLLPSVKSGVAFEVICDTSERDWVFGDSRRLLQILINVTANAIKYTLGGSVTLTTTWDDGNVVFTCVDTGSGIAVAPDDLSDSVYQCGAPSRGLELKVARYLVELYGGTIKAVPSCCCIQLPLVACESSVISTSIKKSEIIEYPLHFLIIDDIQMNRRMIKRRLQKSVCPKCKVSEASTGEEALQLCGLEKFDIIIVDQYMEEAGGVMVGTDVIYTLRRMGVDSIIIGCSGNDLDEEFNDSGADLVWPKPVPPNEDMIRQIRDALAKKV